MTKAIASTLAVLATLAVVAGCGGSRRANAPSTTTTAQSSSGRPVLPDAPAIDFALHDQRGALVRLSALHGRVVLLTFLYTRCRDVCPLIAEHLQSVLDRLGAARSRVRVLAVSVDPVYDTRAAVRRFIREHGLGPQFSYLRGSLHELSPVWQAYNVLAMPRNESVVDHSAPIVLIDARGRPRMYYASDFSVENMIRDVRRYVRT